MGEVGDAELFPIAGIHGQGVKVTAFQYGAHQTGQNRFRADFNENPAAIGV